MGDAWGCGGWVGVGVGLKTGHMSAKKSLVTDRVRGLKCGIKGFISILYSIPSFLSDVGIFQVNLPTLKKNDYYIK